MADFSYVDRNVQLEALSQLEDRCVVVLEMLNLYSGAKWWQII